MNYEDLRSAAETITMPEEMKQRIVTACKTHTTNTGKETTMKNRTFFRKPAAIFAILVICLSLSVTAIAAPGILKGHFRDITNWQGAVVGTAYDHATDEVRVDATVNGNTLTVLAVFADPRMMPYTEAERLGIGAYRIVDAEGNTVEEGSAEAAEIVGGRVAIGIPLDTLDRGNYKLMITSFISEKKADQPLTISGSWECAFTK